ncbi:DUF3810 family protein [Marinicellulosiphila megalodicopiae]|uniref:DUF3810 family protein n=1 Tax=Marinicellulosiphila megalodicopiae TaxID=2724896 RepID=UPI003BAF91E7
MKRFIALKILGIVWIPVVFIIWQVLKNQSEWVEIYYSQWFYPVLIKNISAISSVFGFALHEIVVVSIVLTVIFLIAQDIQLNENKRNRIIGIVLSLISVSGWLYFLLVIMWGINHLRTPVEQMFEIQTPLTEQQEQVVLGHIVEQANELALMMQKSPTSSLLEQCDQLHDSFEIVDKQVNQAMIQFLTHNHLTPVKSAEGRYFIFSGVIRQMGIAGLYNPLVAQPAISSKIPASLQPQTLAHEYAHLNGFADEAAADLVGYLSLLSSSSKQLRYDAWLSLLWQTGQQNNPDLNSAIKADLNCIALNIAIHKNKSKTSLVSTVLKPAVQATNDQYLKQAGHQEGRMRYAVGEQLTLRYLYKIIKKQP